MACALHNRYFKSALLEIWLYHLGNCIPLGQAIYAQFTRPFSSFVKVDTFCETKFQTILKSITKWHRSTMEVSSLTTSLVPRPHLKNWEKGLHGHTCKKIPVCAVYYSRLPKLASSHFVARSVHLFCNTIVNSNWLHTHVISHKACAVT